MIGLSKSSTNLYKEDFSQHLLSNYPTLLFYRHAERPFIPQGTDLREVLTVGLTDQGRKDAENLGKFLKESFPDLDFQLGISSPVERSWETVARTIVGAGWWDPDLSLEEIAVKLETEYILVGYGLYDVAAGQQIINDHSLMLEAINGNFKIGPKSFMETGETLFYFLVDTLNKLDLNNSKSFGLVGSHDMVMMLLLTRYFEIRETSESWPKLLEGILVQKTAPNTVRLAWKNKTVDVSLA